MKDVRCDIFGIRWATIHEDNLKRGDVIAIPTNGFFLIRHVTKDTYKVSPINRKEYQLFRSGLVKQRLRDALMNYPIEDCEDYEEMLTEMEMEMIEYMRPLL